MLQKQGIKNYILLKYDKGNIKIKPEICMQERFRIELLALGIQKIVHY